MAETETGRMLRTCAELGVREVKALVTEQERRTAGELAVLLGERIEESLTDREVARLFAYALQAAKAEQALAVQAAMSAGLRCGYRLTDEQEPCGMEVEFSGPGWRHAYPAADKFHAARPGPSALWH